MVKPNVPVLLKSDYVVEPIGREMADDIVRRLHYARGGSNTAVFTHGLFSRNNFMECLGAAWWIPPTKSAALACWPVNWRGVLALSRLVVDPEVPQNGASFLLAASVRMIREDPRWECLLTYADEAEGHTGAIYRAAGWEFAGRTAAEVRWTDAHGRMVARKAGPRTRTAAEMVAAGYIAGGATRKLRFRRVMVPTASRRAPGVAHGLRSATLD